MKRQTFLTTENLDLVLLTTEDAETITGWMNNHEVTQYLSRGDQPMTIESEVEYLEKVYQNPNHFQLGVWHRTDKMLIGTAGWHNINPRDLSAGFGIMIGEPDYWSQGYGTEVLQTMLLWAFDIRGLRNVKLSVLGNNPRAQKVYERCGFQVIGTYPKVIFKNGQWHDEIVMHCANPLYA
jgi:RimJ/RimL family protein N-acetyltransferase